ncbi:hypothetical protein DB354_18295 [Opitutus sp. ER46]|nr:hypothetical protein DB354_18295 [Opitutus sp. ER46]
MILSSTPSEATGSSGTSSLFTASGAGYVLGTGGALVNPTTFDYKVTGPNTALISARSTSNADDEIKTTLTFTGPHEGIYSTESSSGTATGAFDLAAIPTSAPIANVSSRATVVEGGSTIVGFVIDGTMPRRVLVRAVGAGLEQFGVANPLGNPRLQLYRGNEVLATNDDWGVEATQASLAFATDISGVQASGGMTRGSSSTAAGDSTTGTGTSAVMGSAGGMGSTTGTGSGLAGGGATSGTGSASGTGSTGGAGSTIGTDDGPMVGGSWDRSLLKAELATADDFKRVGAFGLTDGSADSALVVTLPPGPYTVVVSASRSSRVTTKAAADAGSIAGGVNGGTNSTGGMGVGASAGMNGGTGTSGGTGGVTDTGAGTSVRTSGEVLLEVYFIE